MRDRLRPLARRFAPGRAGALARRCALAVMRLARFSELFIDLAQVAMGWPRKDKPRSVVCQRFGARYELSLRDWDDRCLFLGCQEPEAHAWLMTKLRPGDLFVDVGANMGAYSVSAAAAGARVIAFEPQAEPASRLEASLALNPDAEQLVLHRSALSDKAGQLQMYAVEDGTASGNTSLHAFPDATPSEVVQVETLDGILATEQQLIRALKVDVEGHELSVFKGALATLQRLSPDYLMVEVGEEHLTRAGSTGSDLLRLLNDAGYRPAG